MCVVVPRSPCGGTYQSPADPPGNPSRANILSMFLLRDWPDHMSFFEGSYYLAQHFGVAFRPGRRGSPWTHPARGFQFPLLALWATLDQGIRGDLACGFLRLLRALDCARCLGTGFYQREMSALPWETHRPEHIACGQASVRCALRGQRGLREEDGLTHALGLEA